MANTKISALPAAPSYSFTDVLPIVDGLSTNKIDATLLLRNTSNVVESTTNTNAIAIATDAGSAGFQVLRGTNATSAVIAATDSYIDGGQNHFIGGGQGCSIQTGAAGHSGIVGADGVSITGGYNQFIGGSYNGPSITGGEENSILSSIGGTQVSGNNNAAIGTQGVVVDGSKTIALGVEGSTQQAGSYVVFGAGYNYQSQINNLSRQGHFAFQNLNVGDGLAGFDIGGSLATSGATITLQGSAGVSLSNQTTLYNWTLHTDNLYSFGRIQTATEISTSVSNVQTLSGGLGMVQYTDVPAGNMNLAINDVRNGEVYHWVISNDTGGSISINSTSTNTGYAIHQDVGGGSFGTGKHLFTIAVVNNMIVISHPH